MSSPIGTFPLLQRPPCIGNNTAKSFHSSKNSVFLNFFIFILSLSVKKRNVVDKFQGHSACKSRRFHECVGLSRPYVFTYWYVSINTKTSVH